MHALFQLTNDGLVRTGLVVLLLGTVWAMVSLQAWCQPGKRFISLPTADACEGYVTRTGAAIIMTIGTALVGFGITV